MRIGIVLSKPPSYSETFFLSKIKGLQVYGHEVILYVQTTDTDFDLCKVKTAYPVFKRNLIKQLWYLMLVLIKLMISLRSVKKYIQNERRIGVNGFALAKKVYSNAHILPDQLDWLHFGFATMALGKENVAESIGAKLAVSFRGFDLSIYPVKHRNCYELLWRKVTKVHSISTDLYNLALQDGLSKSIPMQRITPAIATDLFKNLNAANVTDGVPIKIMTIARLHWKKGLTYTLMALKELKEQGLCFQYTLVGEGVEYEKLMYLRHQLGLENEVTLLGKVGHLQVRQLLSEHNYYIQYSISEGFCNAVLEAQSMGLLCIVSDAEGLPENVLHGKSGWVVPKRMPTSLAQQFQKVAGMPLIEKKNIQEFAIERIRKEFSLEKQRKEFNEFYSN